MVVVFPFNDPTPPRSSSRSPAEPSYSISKKSSGNKLDVSLPGVSRDDTKVEVSGSKVKITGKKNGEIAFKLEVRLSGAENGVDVRAENGSVTVKCQKRRSS